MLENLQVFTGEEHRPFELGDGAKGVVLLIHGFPGTPAEMRGLGEWLAQRGWLAKGILLPGFGPDIPNLKDRTRCDWVDAARQTWQELRKRHERLFALGFSMGAAVALHLDLQPGDRLGLVAPFWRFGGILPRLVPLVRRIKPELAPFRKADFSEPRLRDMLQRALPGADLDDPDLQELIREQFVLPLNAAEELIRIGREGYRRAAEIHSDCLVVQGTDDVLVKPDATRKLVSRLIHGRCTYVEVHGGHNLLAVDEPVHLEVFQAVEKFIRVGEV